jgi:CDP-glucose 4,6-dehydratase
MTNTPTNETSTWVGRRVLVTGATGLLGSALVDDLVRRGAEVVALVRDWNPQRRLLGEGIVQHVSVVSGALEQPGTVERAITQHDVDTVFHLAAQALVGTALRDPLQTLESNVRGSYLLLDACRRHRDLVRAVVVASSDKAYGTVPTLPYVEDTPLAGRHPYDVSKSCTDLVAQAYAHTYGLPIVIARCGNLYGPGDLHWSRLVPGTIRSLLSGQPPIIRSDGTYRRDYVHVDDAVSAYLRLAERVDDPAIRGRGWNFGPGRSHAVLEVVNLLRTLMDATALEPVILGQAVGEIRDQHLDPSAARDVLGWTASITLEEGLTRTIPWYRERLGATHGRLP